MRFPFLYLLLLCTLSIWEMHKTPLGVVYCLKEKRQIPISQISKLGKPQKGQFFVISCGGNRK